MTALRSILFITNGWLCRSPRLYHEVEILGHAACDVILLLS